MRFDADAADERTICYRRIARVVTELLARDNRRAKLRH
jgi:hypothetical protein